MKQLLGIVVLLLFALPAQAQYVQGDVINAAPDTIGGNWTAKASYAYTFKQPLLAPCTLIVTVRGPGLSITDSQGNAFSLLTNNAGRSGQAFSSPTCASGADTITVSCPSGPCWVQATFSAYAGQWRLAQVAPDADGLSATAATPPVTPSSNGSLIVSFGSNHTTNTPQITAGTGFTLRASGNEFIEDFIQATAAPVAGTATYSAPVSWCQMTLVFTLAGPPPPPTSVTVDIGQLLWCAKCDGSDDTPVTGNFVVAQTGGPSTTVNINPDGSVQVSGSIDFSQDPIQFVFELTDAGGVVQPGASLTWTVPLLGVDSSNFKLGTITVGKIHLAHTVDADGNPAVRLVDATSFSLGK